jgi:glycosyltransferase involved in cell wall biosynthesis
MRVQKKLSSDPHVLSPRGKLSAGWSSLRPTLDMLPLYLAGAADRQFSPAWLGGRQTGIVGETHFDVLHLHWIQKGFVRIESLRRMSFPIVWTLHDMWPFTGGCHYDNGCGRYAERCGACPVLSSSRQNDLSRRVWKRKERAWKELEFVVVCPSRWMASRAQQSSLFAHRRIEVIHNGLDLQRFRLLEQRQAREWLGLPFDKRLVLFSAVKARENIYKGYQSFRKAMQVLSERGWGERLEVVVLGSSGPDGDDDMPLPVHYLGHFHDEVSLALAHAAVDVFVLSSLQDNLPNTLLESLACGTPCVAFDVGGVSDAVVHQATGFLAKTGDVEGLASGVEWVLGDTQRWLALCQASRKKAEIDFDQLIQARRHLSLYEALVKQRRD